MTHNPFIENETMLPIASLNKVEILFDGEYGELLFLNDNYEDYLKKSIELLLDRKVNLMLIHDVTAASFSIELFRNENTAIISLGTSVGVSFGQFEIYTNTVIISSILSYKEDGIVRSRMIEDLIFHSKN